MKRGTRETTQSRTAENKDGPQRKTAFIAIFIASITVCVYLVVSLLLHLPGELHTVLIAAIAVFMAAFGAIFAFTYKPEKSADPLAAFKKAVAAFFSWFPVAACAGLLVACVLATTLPSQITSGNVSAAAPPAEEPPSPLDPEPTPWEQSRIPLTAWAEDPFLAKTDEYMGYHVEMEKLEDVLFAQLSMTMEFIQIVGPYNPDVLEASEYGRKVYLATLSESCYETFANANERREKQIEMLLDANQLRTEANSTYMVCENLKMMGGNAIHLGDLHEDNNEKLEYYKEAFGHYRGAYCCAISECLSTEELGYIVEQLEFISTKLEGLNMHNWERSSAPHIVAALRRVMERY